MMGDLLSLSLFQGLEQGQSERLIALMEERTAKDGEILFSEGDEGQALYIIVSGKVLLSKDAGLGVSATVAELESGQVLGEMALISDAPRTTSCTIVGDTRLLKLNKDTFNSLENEDMAVYSTLLANLTSIVCSRLGTATSRVVEMLETLRMAQEQRMSLQEQFEKSRCGLLGFFTDLFS